MMRVWTPAGWKEETELTPALVRQVINSGEIGGEMADDVLKNRLIHGLPSYASTGGSQVTVVSEIAAAIAIDEAHVAGFIKPGFWDPKNWQPAYPDRDRG